MSTESYDRHIEIGKVGRPHGVRGEVRIFMHDSESSTLAHVEAIVLQRSSDSPRERHRIRRARPARAFWRVLLEGVEDRDAASALTGALCFVRREELPEPEADEFYVDDLMGATVMTPEGRCLGTVQDLFDNGAHGVLVVQDMRESGSKPMLIPFVDDYLVSIDLEARTLCVHPIEFLD